ncbi:MAG: DUF4154 domain-containing protein [Candidatus Aminicenantes bacterium]|nr:MAG: DUF4154 domain-containing protein [Candidatus Aminicenantes bacterium]
MSDVNRKKQLFNAVQGYIKIFLAVFLIIQLSISATAATAEEMEAPIDIQIPLFLKILPYDRNLEKRVGDEIVIGILYQEKFRTSLNVKNQIEDYLKNSGNKKIEDIPFRCVSINLRSLSEVKTTLAREEVDIVYITPLRAIAVETLVSVCRSMGITSLTGVPAYCELGIAISIGSKGESPLIIINLTGARSEGADFSSRLLKLAKVIK